MKTRKLILLIALAVSLAGCKMPLRKDAAGPRYVFLEQPTDDPVLFGKFSRHELTELISNNLPDQPYADTMYVGQIHAFTASGDPSTDDADSVIIVLLSFSDHYGNLYDETDSVIGEAIKISVKNEMLSITDREFISGGPFIQQPQPAVSGPVEDTKEEFGRPALWVNVFPEGGSPVYPMQTYYNTVTAMDVFDEVFATDAQQDEYSDTAYIGYATVSEETLVWLNKEGTAPVRDSLIVAYFTYSAGPEDYEMEYEQITHYEMHVLELREGQLRTVVSEYLGALWETAGAGHSNMEHYNFEMFRISPEASAIGIYHTSEEGSEYAGHSWQELSLYVLEGDDLVPAFNTGLGQSTYEAHFQGPPEEHYSRSEVYEGELSVLDELYNGYYRLACKETHREYENEQIVHEMTQTNYFVWEAGGYIQQGGGGR